MAFSDRERKVCIQGCTVVYRGSPEQAWRKAKRGAQPPSLSWMLPRCPTSAAPAYEGGFDPEGALAPPHPPAAFLLRLSLFSRPQTKTIRKTQQKDGRKFSKATFQAFSGRFLQAALGRFFTVLRVSTAGRLYTER